MRCATTSPRLAGGVLLLVLAFSAPEPAQGGGWAAGGEDGFPPAGAARQRDRGAEQALAELPRRARDALDRAAEVYKQPLKGARWSKAYVLRGTDHPIYQVQGTNGRGNKVEMEVTSAGRIIEVEEHGIPLREVPSAVIEALKAKWPDFEPAKVEAIYQAERPHPVSYGFEGKGPGGRRIEAYISADGKTVLN